MWNNLFGWPVISAVAIGLIGIGFSLLSMTPPAFDAARVCITGGAMLLSVKIASWLVANDSPILSRVSATVLIFGLLGVGWTETWRWIGRREAVVVQAAPTIINLGQGRQDDHSTARHAEKVERTAEEDTKSNTTADGPVSRHPSPNGEPGYSGPFPPFSLGGSLEENDFRDAFGDFRGWMPVKKGVDVTIDWRSIGSAELVVDGVVKGTSGVCRLGIWDVDNDVLVSQSEQIAVAPDEINVTFPIPREAGTKKYRLVTRGPEDRSAAFFGASGEINFPSYSLGGSTALDNPGPGTDWHAIDGFRDVEIDWSRVQPPLNKVVLDAVLLVSDYVRGESTIPSIGHGRIRLRNLVDNSTVAESEWIDAGRRSVHHSYRPGRGTLRTQLPTGTGRVRYRLEVASSGPVVAVAVFGRLGLRH
jgi:hypothetical protein